MHTSVRPTYLPMRGRDLGCFFFNQITKTILYIRHIFRYYEGALIIINTRIITCVRPYTHTYNILYVWLNRVRSIPVRIRFYIFRFFFLFLINATDCIIFRARPRLKHGNSFGCYYYFYVFKIYFGSSEQRRDSKSSTVSTFFWCRRTRTESSRNKSKSLKTITRSDVLSSSGNGLASERTAALYARV